MRKITSTFSFSVFFCSHSLSLSRSLIFPSHLLLLSLSLSFFLSLSLSLCSDGSSHHEENHLFFILLYLSLSFFILFFFAVVAVLFMRKIIFWFFFSPFLDLYLIKHSSFRKEERLISVRLKLFFTPHLCLLAALLGKSPLKHDIARTNCP